MQRLLVTTFVAATAGLSLLLVAAAARDLLGKSEQHFILRVLGLIG
jgi:hypothetical protein